MAKFRHITDDRAGAYPHLANQDVYMWKPNYDYEQWQEQATLELCNVPFNSDYDDIVDWQTPEARDAQLAERIFYTSEPLKTHFRIDKNGQVKVPPIPADVIDRANYLIVRNPIAPVPHETADGVRNLFYFILDVEQESPNATRLTVTLDWWTTYFDKLNITSGYVERGHIAAHEAATPEEFLKNPIANTAHLLAPDLNINSQGELVTWQRAEALEGERAIVFRLYNDINQLNLARPADVVSNTISAPAYSGSFSESVSGFEWNLGAQSASGQTRTARTATLLPPHGLGDNSKNNLGGWLYAVPSHNASRFFDNLAAYFPHILQNIDTVFILPSQLLEVRERAVVADVEIALVRPKPIKTDIKLTPADFAYPPEYAHLTKLYTSPYARLRLTDLNGAIQEIEIQNTTSETSLNIIASLVAGGAIRAEIDNTQSEQSEQYSWRLVALNQTEQRTLYGGAGAYMLEKQIPTYQLQLGSQKLYDLANAHNTQLARSQAITSYETGQAQLATATQNTRRSADNARADALAGIAAAQAALANALTNMQVNQDIQTYQTAENTTIQRDTVEFGDTINRQQRSANLSIETEYQSQSLQNQQNSNAAKTGVGILASFGSALASGNPAALVGAAIDGLSSGVNMAIENNQASQATTLTLSRSLELLRMENDAERAKRNNQRGQYYPIGGADRNVSFYGLVNRQSQLSVAVLVRQVEELRRQIRTSTQISTDLQESTSSRALTVAYANANASATTSTNVAQRNLDMAGLAAATGYVTSGLAPHSSFGSAAGSHTALEAERDGYAVQVVTPTSDEISRIGDYFLMYGYAANRIYDMSTLGVMPYFTYWQVSRVFFQPTANAYVNEQVKNLFAAGVTVWRRIEDVNTMKIYENKEI